jgi:hypothetical protein
MYDKDRKTLPMNVSSGRCFLMSGKIQPNLGVDIDGDGE